jgi:hypothetical protein
MTRWWSTTNSTGRPSGPTTVHDSTPLDGIRTRLATNPRTPIAPSSSMTHQNLERSPDGPNNENDQSRRSHR